MFVEKHLIPFFKQFLLETSETEILELDVRTQPDIKFVWLENLHWGFKKSGGYEIFAEEIETLEATWDNALQQFFQQQQEQSE